MALLRYTTRTTIPTVLVVFRGASRGVDTRGTVVVPQAKNAKVQQQQQQRRGERMDPPSGWDEGDWGSSVRK